MRHGRPSLQRSITLRGNILAFAAPATGSRSSNFAREQGCDLARELAVGWIEQRIDTATIFRELRISDNFSVSGDTVTFNCSAIPGLPTLPPHYGYKGGAARFALQHALAQGELTELNQLAPRDLDIVRRYGVANSGDEKLMERLNRNDYDRGASVEEFRSLDRYFNSRDLTINEVVTFDAIGKASILAVLDLLGCTLRPCKYSGGSLHTGRRLAPMTVAKCLRLMAEGDMTGQSPNKEEQGASSNRNHRPIAWQVVGIPEQQEVTSLAIAVQLRKALERDHLTAERFLRYCVESGISFSDEAGEATEHDLPKSDRTPAWMVEEVITDLPEGERFFTNDELAILRAMPRDKLAPDSAD